MTIRLNNGREFDADHCIQRGDTLGICIDGDYTLLEIAQIFSHITDTERITSVDGDVETVYEGYTLLTTVNIYPWDRGRVQIVLTREEE